MQHLSQYLLRTRCFRIAPSCQTDPPPPSLPVPSASAVAATEYLRSERPAIFLKEHSRQTNSPPQQGSTHFYTKISTPGCHDLEGPRPAYLEVSHVFTAFPALGLTKHMIRCAFTGAQGLFSCSSPTRPRCALAGRISRSIRTHHLAGLLLCPSPTRPRCAPGQPYFQNHSKPSSGWPSCGTWDSEVKDRHHVHRPGRTGIPYFPVGNRGSDQPLPVLIIPLPYLPVGTARSHPEANAPEAGLQVNMKQSPGARLPSWFPITSRNP